MTTGKYAANALAVGQFGDPHAARIKARSRTSHLRAFATVSPIALLLGLTGPTSTASAASCTPDTTACDAAGGVTTGNDPTRGGPGGAGNGTGGSGSRFDAGTGATVINPGSPSSAGNGGAGGAGDSAGGAGGGVGATNQQAVPGALNGGVGTDGPGGFNFSSGGGAGGAGLFFGLGGAVTVQGAGIVTGGNGGAGGAGTSGNQSNGGGGGGGGAGVIIETNGLTTNNFGSITGGNGGAGGGGGNAGGGGGGGDGFLGTGIGLSLLNAGSITGGRGGNAGTGSSANATAGDSGAGVNLMNPGGTVINNAGATITGGAANGGAAGVGVMTSGRTFINNFGTISGGLNNDGVTHAAAIRFGGTGNGLNLFAGSTIIGDIQLIPGAGATIGAVVAGQTLGNNIVLGSGSAVTFSSSNADLSVSGVISGAGSVTKTVAGTVTLSGTNTYTGGTTLSGGTLSVSSDANLGAASGALTFNGGTLQVTGTTFTGTSRTINWAGGGFEIVDAANNFTAGQSLTGNGALTKSGAGTLTLTGSNSYVGGTTISAGTLQLGNGGTSGSLTGDVLNNGTLAVNRSNASTLGGNISGSGAFVQQGTGTTILTGTNSYAGGTTIAAGTLQLGNGGTTGSITGDVLNNGTFAINRSDTTTFAGNISGGGAFEQRGTGTTILTGTNSYGGGTTLAAGKLSVSSDANLGAAAGALTFSGGTLQVTGTSYTGTSRTINFDSGGGFEIVDAANNFVVSTILVGHGALTKTGAGTLTLADDVIVPGGITISAGTLQFGNGGFAGTLLSNTIVNNGTLAINYNDAVVVGETISGTGVVELRGAGQTTLSGTNTYSGGTILTAGTLNASSDANLGAPSGALTFNGGTLRLTQPGFTSTARTINWNGGGFAVDTPSLNFTVSSSFAGSGGLTKSGSGTLTFTGNDSYTGGTTIAGGTLQLGNGGTSGAITGDVLNNALLAVNRSDTYTFAGNISGNGAFQQRGAGTTILTGTNSYIGGTTISNGTLQIGNGGTSGSIAGNVVNNGHLIFNRSDDIAFAGAISGNGLFTKSGGGTLTLSGNNTYSGGTQLLGGTLAVQGGNAIGDNSSVIVLGGSTLRLLSNETVATLSSGTTDFGTVDLAAGNLTTSLNSTITTAFYYGSLSGAGGFTKAGTYKQVLAGDGTYTGGTTISGGTLQLGDGGTSGSISGNVTNNATLAVNRSDTYTFAGNISGSGAFVQSGTGTTILTGTNVYAGGTTISAGTLQLGDGGSTGAIIGDITNNGTLAVNRSDIFSLGGVISGSGAFVQKGIGTVILTGNNSYAGGTTVSLGTLSVSSDANLGAASGALSFNSGGTLQVTGTSFTGTARAIDLGSGGGAFDIADAANNFTLGQSITGNGSLIKLGAGTLTLTGNSSLTGGVGISGGTLQLGDGGTSGAFLGSVQVGSGGLFAINRSDTIIFDSAIFGGGAFEQRGSGTTILTGTSTYIGGTTISQGTLQLGNGGTTGSIVGDITNNGAFAVNRSDTFTFGGSISGNGAFAQIGTGTTILTGNNSYIGGSTISAGTLQLGNGGTAGSITGDVTNNGVFAVNRSDSFTFGGSISGSGAFAQRGTGTTILTGTNTYTGGTTLAAGTLSVSADANLGAGAGALTFSGGTLQVTGTGFTGTSRTISWSGGGFDIADASNDFAVSSAIAGSGALTKSGAGTLTFTGNNLYSGGTTIAQGTLQLGNGGTSGSITGDVTNNGTFAVNRSDTVALSGNVSGSGTFAQRGTGATILTGTNTYTGGTTIAQGTLQIGDGGTTGSITGDVFNNGTLAFNRSDAIAFPGAISGTGNLVKLGAGTLTLNGQYSYTGATTVNAGKLVVGDAGHGSASLASIVTVNNGGTLGGIGTIGGLNVAGGTVAPGNSIGTLNVAGNVAFAAGSIYQIEANAAGQSDRILASGTATLGGGNVLALAQTGIYAPQTVYNVLTANGGVSGSFTGISTSLIFLTPSLSYDANNVFLNLGRNDISLASVAQTPNQVAVAGALDASRQLTNPLMIAVLNQTAPGARQAFDALSGEVHASAQTAMLDDSRYLRDAVLGRLRQSSFAGSAGPMAALASGGPQIAEMDSLVASSARAYAGAERPGFPVKAPPPARLAPLPETTFWTQGVGAWGQLDGNGNAARMTRDLAGFFSGVDHRFATNWVAGIAGGYTSSTVRVSARASSADIQTAHIAGYTGASYGAFNLRGGAGASFSTLDTSRSIVFPGFVDSARARYDATTAQVFGEIGYGIALGNAAVEPFAGLAYAHLDTDRFSETGGSGAAALVGARNNEDVGYSSLGARIATSFAVFNAMQLTPRASVAWQYAFGDVTPTAALAFQSLGTGFTVAGVPLARSTALVEGGLDLRVTPQASVGIAYVGQLGDRVQDHSVKANFSWKF